MQAAASSRHAVSVPPSQGSAGGDINVHVGAVAPALLAIAGGGLLLSPQLLSDAVRRLGNIGQHLSGATVLSS